MCSSDLWVTGVERFTSGTNDIDVTGAMFVATMDNVYFYDFRQGVVLAIDRCGLMGKPFRLTLAIAE